LKSLFFLLSRKENNYKMMNFGEHFYNILNKMMLEVYLMTTTEEGRRESEYSYFYDAIVKEDLCERQKMLEETNWSVGWSRENNQFEYVSDNGILVGFDIDSQPPTVEELRNKCQGDDFVVVVGEIVRDGLEPSAPTLNAILS